MYTISIWLYMHIIFNNRRTNQDRNQSKMKNIMMMMNSQHEQLQLQQQYQQHQHQHQQQQQHQQQHQQKQKQKQQVDGISSPHWTAKETDDDIKEDQRRPGVLHLSARSLNIVWGNDKRFWQWISHNREQEEQKQESYHHFDYSAELLQVNWIEVSGKLSFNNSKLCPLVAYEIYYVVKFKTDAFGWHSIPIKFKVKQTTESSNTMETEGKTSEESEISEILESYRKSHDVWQCIYGGQFIVPADRQGFVEFGMFEVDSDWWKGSMVLHGVKLEPKRSMTEPTKLNIEV